MAVHSTRASSEYIQKELPRPGKLFNCHNVPVSWSEIKSPYISKFEDGEEAVTILKDMPKNTAIRSLVGFVDVAASKETDLTSLFDKLMDAKIVKWTLAAEYLVTYKINEPGWTIVQFMDIVYLYTKMRCYNLANILIGITVDRFGGSAVANYPLNLNHLYIAVQPQLGKKKKSDVCELPPNPDELLRHAKVDMKEKMKLLGMSPFRYLAKYMTNEQTLRGVEHIRENINDTFYNEFIVPSSYLSLEGLLAAEKKFNSNKMINKHEVGMYMLLHGHDGYNRLSISRWKHLIWKGKHPCPYAGKIKFDTLKPFKPFHDTDMVTVPNDEVKEILMEMSAIYPNSKHIMKDLTEMEVN